MAMVWAGSTLGASSQEPHVLNFFYPAFFAGMMLHRCALVCLPAEACVCVHACMHVERELRDRREGGRSIHAPVQRQCAHCLLEYKYSDNAHTIYCTVLVT